jgi:hypothetical protein
MTPCFLSASEAAGKLVSINEGVGNWHSAVSTQHSALESLGNGGRAKTLWLADCWVLIAEC